jgi:hypothetical protein
MCIQREFHFILEAPPFLNLLKYIKNTVMVYNDRIFYEEH